jgi:hypothetical protein
VRCGRNEPGQNCPTIVEQFKTFKPINPDAPVTGPTSNTTITLVVTNQKLPFWALQRLAMQVHSSMSRAIQPFATREDGDILYAVSTDEVENANLSPVDLGVIASELAWDAILTTVPSIPDRPLPLKTAPNLDSLKKLVGDYEFYGGGKLVITFQAGKLAATFEGNGRIYFDKDKSYSITPAEGGLFIIESPGREVLRFGESGGKVINLTMNPGPWALQALPVR